MKRRHLNIIEWSLSKVLFGASIQIASIRILAFLATAVGLMWMALGLYFDQPWLAWLSFIFAANSVICAVLGAVKYELLARIIWFAVSSSVILAGSMLVHPSGMLPQLFTGVLASVFLNFSLRRERGAAMATFGMVVLSWALSLYLPTKFPGFMVVDHVFAEAAVAPMVMATTLLTVGANIAIFAFLAEKSNERQISARADAEHANKIKSAFLATVSHEVRTPMNGVIGMADILAASDLSESQMKSLNVIRDSAQSLLRIIEDILDMSSFEAGKLKLVEEQFDLPKMIESAVESLRAYADQNNVLAHLLMSSNLPRTIRGDGIRLRQIILNIFGNAIKFSRRPQDDRPGRAVISINLLPDNVLEFVFSDDGIGITKDFLPHLFEPFGRSEMVSTRRFGGTGLGLAIVKELVTKMDGRITVASDPGHGSQFTISIPVEVIEGAKPGPDMTGQIVVLAGLDDVQTEFWGRILSGTEATRVDLPKGQMFDGIAKLLEGQGSPSVIVFSNYDDSGKSHPERLGILREKYSNVPVIMHCRNRGRESGLIDEHTYVLQSVPTLRSEAEDGLFALRRGAQLAHTKSQPEERASSEVQPTPTSGHVRILLAEDNAINQVVLATQLTRLGHKVDVADDGLQALRAWRAGQYDLLLTDCHMPEMDGIGLTSAIRSEELRLKLRPIPIIAITANAQPDEGVRCLSVGMNAVLTKPVRFADLTSVIEEHVFSANATDHEERKSTA